MSDSSPARSNLAPSTLDRINLRLQPEMFAAIDDARLARAGHVSRNTWLTEAVQEKLARDAADAPELGFKRG